MKIGYLGLGKMGKNMVLRLLEQGIEVVAWNRSPEPLNEVVKSGAFRAEAITDVAEKLDSTRIIWLMLPQGKTTDLILSQLLPSLTKGDLVIDGANAFYKDSIKRAKKLAKKGIRFMDIGVSGGPSGARKGACLMVGGDKKDFKRVLPLIIAASAPKAYGHFGSVGAGHFAKMVHNGIEYGMMQAIGEGAAVLKGSQFKLDLAEVFRVYNLDSVIESRLVGWAQEALAEDSDLKHISSTINQTGEGEWTVKEAEKLKVSAPVIKASFQTRVSSSKDKPNSLNGFRNKLISALRGKFGHHKVGSNQ
jgi:6-phosphogluconate dehydrogenase